MLSFAIQAQSPVLQWARSFGDLVGDYGEKIAVDKTAFFRKKITETTVRSAAH